MTTQKTTLLTTTIAISMMTLAGCATQNPTSQPPQTQAKKTTTQTAKPTELQPLLSWMEAECGMNINDEDSAYGKSQQAFSQFSNAPKSSQYSTFVSSASIDGKQGILGMDDSRVTTINLKNATYRGLPINKVIIDEAFEHYETTYFFDTNIASLKPYFQNTYGATNFSNNSISCNPLD